MTPREDTPENPDNQPRPDAAPHQWNPHARRIAPLIDGIEYYPAVHHAISNAQHQILILGWELHSEVRLLRGEQADNPAAPPVLADLLEHAANANPHLTAHLLIWEGASLFALEREHLPRMTRPWEKHPRVRLVWDTDTPELGSHHQKLVVIDDRIAFTGGMDLTRARWDSHQHHQKDPRRRTPGILPIHGNPYHDTMIALDDQAAQTLGDWARKRWKRATGQTLEKPPRTRDHDQNTPREPWPPSLEPILKDRPVAISLTQPDFAGRPEIRQVERAFIEQINNAERSIFIETQYLAAESIANTLAKRLEEPQGPEVILIMPFGCPGKLQSMAMDTRRDQLLKQLRNADRHQRLGAYWPTLAAGDSNEPFKTSVYVHAKVLITDNRLLRIGSANLNNRSMGLDTELDCTVTASRDDHEAIAAIAHLRRRLLAYLLAIETPELEKAEREHSSILAAVESLRTGERTLHPFTHSAPKFAEQLRIRTELADPPAPVGKLDAQRVLQEIARHTTPGQKIRKAASNITGFLKKPLNPEDPAGPAPDDPNTDYTHKTDTQNTDTDRTDKENTATASTDR